MGTVAFSYDALGRVAARQFQDTQNQTYLERAEYRLDDELSSLVLQAPDNNFAPEVVKYGYDSANRLRTIAFSDATSSRAMGAMAPDKDATAFRATLLANVGRMREAVSLLHVAAGNDKLSLIDSLHLQSALTSAWDFEEAEREYKRSMTLDGDSIEALFLALIRAVLAEPTDRQRVDAAFRAVLAHPLGDSTLNRFVHQNFGQPALVRARLRQEFGSASSSAIQIAFLADWFDDDELALAALRRALMDLGAATSLLWVPLRTGARSTPEFRELVKDVGLVDYWRATGNWGDYCRPVDEDDFTCK